MSADTKADECSICLDFFQKQEPQAVLLLACNHVFHIDCLTNWLREKGENSKCPVCRKSALLKTTTAGPYLFECPYCKDSEMYFGSHAALSKHLAASHKADFIPPTKEP